jgi:hypothetical protein
MRVVVLAVVLVGAFAATASAQQPQNTNTPVAAATSVFSKSSIDRAVASAINSSPRTVTAAAAAPVPVPRHGKNVFKTPWPYIIGGGIAAVALIAVYSGNSSTGTGPY